MKQVIFVCLLALSVCFSQASTPVETVTQKAPLEQQNATANETKTNATKPDQTAAAAAAPADASKPTAAIAGTPDAQNVASTTTQTMTVSNETTPKPNETKQDSEKNKSTETKTDVTTPKPLDPTNDKNGTKPFVPAKPAVTNSTNADGMDGKKTETSTPKGENVSPTVAPVEAKSRAFDGPSFIGGIILTLGLLAIGFMGFKYYKNQTERNYHTL